MKAFIILVIGLATFGLYRAADAQAPAAAQAPESSSVEMLANNITGINVPYEVLEYAQMKYQGHAVIQASKAYSGGRPVYRLLVDNDDIPDDDKCIVLIYSMDWKLLGDEEIAAPSRAQETPRGFEKSETESDSDRQKPEKPHENHDREPEIPDDDSDDEQPAPEPPTEPEPQPEPPRGRPRRP